MFVWAEEGTELKVTVPIVFKGEDVSPGLRKGNQFFNFHVFFFFGLKLINLIFGLRSVNCLNK